MGRDSTRAVVNAAKADIAAAVSRSMRAVSIAVGDRSEEEIRAAFDLPQSEAPMWTHTAKQLAAATVKADQAAGPTVNNQLNLVLVEKAESNESWLASVQKFKHLADGKRPVIEAKAEPSTDSSGKPGQGGKSP